MRIAGALALWLLPWVAALAQAPTDAQAARETEFDGLRVLGSQHRGVYFGYVTDDTRPSEGMYLCGGMSRADAESAATSVAGALQSIPDASLARLRLRYVVLCSRALAGGQAIGGIPVPPLNLLMLDVGSDSGGVQHSTLHELYHLLEYRLGVIQDSAWTAQFDGYTNRYPGLLRRSPIGSGKAGFINAYGETHAHEERAELFAYLMLAPRDVAAQIRRAGDEVLRRKANYVIDRCQQIGLPVALPG